jgi:hypothetical protein
VSVAQTARITAAVSQATSCPPPDLRDFPTKAGNVLVLDASLTIDAIDPTTGSHVSPCRQNTIILLTLSLILRNDGPVPVSKINVTCGLYDHDDGRKADVRLDDVTFTLYFPRIRNGEEGRSKLDFGNWLDPNEPHDLGGQASASVVPAFLKDCQMVIGNNDAF